MIPRARPTRVPTRKAIARRKGEKGALRRVDLNTEEGENVREVLRGQSDGMEILVEMTKNDGGEARHINCSAYFMFLDKLCVWQTSL